MTHGEESSTDHLTAPDLHVDPTIAGAYDASHGDRFESEVVDATVRTLSELAAGGPAVEFAVGTGRIALPLARGGVNVHGIDFSQPMLDQLQAKPDADLIETVLGDMTAHQVCSDAKLVYLVFNTIMNLRTQEQQVACFRNAARHLAPGGRFLIETMVPQLHRLPPGETIRPFDVSPDHLGFDEYVDAVNQISISHHLYINGERVRRFSSAFRYVWPSELDLMAQLVGMTLESRWANWSREPFTDSSTSHVSVWRTKTA